jgi:hypothetical protein
MLGLATLVPRDPFNLVVLAVGVLSVFVLATFAIAFKSKSETSNFQAYLKFAYACFLKPHTGDKNGDQQDALVHCFAHDAYSWLIVRRKASTRRRRTCTMLRARDFSKDAKICWVW